MYFLSFFLLSVLQPVSLLCCACASGVYRVCIPQQKFVHGLCIQNKYFVYLAEHGYALEEILHLRRKAAVFGPDTVASGSPGTFGDSFVLLAQTCQYCPAAELSFVRSQPITTRHSVISAPVAPRAQEQSAASRVRLSKTRLLLITSDLPDVSGKSCLAAHLFSPLLAARRGWFVTTRHRLLITPRMRAFQVLRTHSESKLAKK